MVTAATMGHLARVLLAIVLLCFVQLPSEAAARASEATDAGDSGKSGAMASPPTSTLGGSPSHAVDTVCISPHLYRRSGFIETVPSLQQSKRTWERCQKCPDAWSKCEPCSDQTVLQTALDIVEHLRFAGNREKANAPALDAAVDYYGTALRRSSHPESSMPRHRLRDEVEVGLADLYYFDLGRPDLAVEHYRNLAGATVDAEIATHARLMLGELRLDTGDWLDAEKELRGAAATGAGYKTLCALYKQAWALLRMGRTAGARKVLRACASANVHDRFFDNRIASLRKACAADEKRLQR